MCDDDHITDRKVIQFSLAVSLQSLWTVSTEQWSTLSTNLMAQKKLVDAFTAELMQTMHSLCKQCHLTEEHFINPTTDVGDEPTYNVTGIYYTSNFVYSSPEGNVTASTLVTLLQQWLLEAEENEMRVTVSEADSVIYKPCGLDNSKPTSKALCLASLSTELQAESSPLNSSQAHTSAVIAGTLVGGILVGVICTVIAALVWSVATVSYIYYNDLRLTLRSYFFHMQFVCVQEVLKSSHQQLTY